MLARPAPRPGRVALAVLAALALALLLTVAAGVPVLDYLAAFVQGLQRVVAATPQWVFDRVNDLFA